MKNYNIYVHKYGIENIEFVQFRKHNMNVAWILLENGEFIDVSPHTKQDYRDEYELL